MNELLKKITLGLAIQAVGYALLFGVFWVGYAVFFGVLKIIEMFT